MRTLEVQKKIVITDFDRELYEELLRQKNFKLLRALRYLLFRSDFQTLLNYLEKHGLKKTKKAEFHHFTHISKKGAHKTWEFFSDHSDNHLLAKDHPLKAEGFYEDAYGLIWDVYLKHMFLINKGIDTSVPALLKEVIGQQNITMRIFDHSAFYGLMNGEYISSDKKNPIKASNFDEFEKVVGEYAPYYEEGYSLLERPKPKVCQIVIEEGVKKEDLRKFIDKHFKEIEKKMLVGIPEARKTRSSADFNLIRDIDVFNKYQEFKDGDSKHPDVLTCRWLREVQHHNLDSVTVRKIYSDIKKELRAINSGA